MIPTKPEKVRRLNITVDDALLKRAKALRMDIPEFVRRSLWIAVEDMESKGLGPASDVPSPKQSLQDTLRAAKNLLGGLK